MEVGWLVGQAELQELEKQQLLEVEELEQQELEQQAKTECDRN